MSYFASHNGNVAFKHKNAAQKHKIVGLKLDMCVFFKVEAIKSTFEAGVFTNLVAYSVNREILASDT